jgi:hypothetical protein
MASPSHIGCIVFLIMSFYDHIRHRVIYNSFCETRLLEHCRSILRLPRLTSARTLVCQFLLNSVTYLRTVVTKGLSAICFDIK